MANKQTLMLDPRLGMAPKDFVAAWNASPDCRSKATARLAPAPAVQFGFDPLLAEQGVVLLEGLLLGLATNALYDGIKELLVRRSLRRRVTILEVTGPDGTRMLYVTQEED